MPTPIKAGIIFFHYGPLFTAAAVASGGSSLPAGAF